MLKIHTIFVGFYINRGTFWAVPHTCSCQHPYSVIRPFHELVNNKFSGRWILNLNNCSFAVRSCFWHIKNLVVGYDAILLIFWGRFPYNSKWGGRFWIRIDHLRGRPGYWGGADYDTFSWHFAWQHMWGQHFMTRMCFYDDSRVTIPADLVPKCDVKYLYLLELFDYSNYSHNERMYAYHWFENLNTPFRLKLYGLNKQCEMWVTKYKCLHSMDWHLQNKIKGVHKMFVYIYNPPWSASKSKFQSKKHPHHFLRHWVWRIGLFIRINWK